MRSYLIDEISSSDMDKISEFLKKNAIKSSLGQILWVRMPDNLLSDIQNEHRDCRPHVFSAELGLDWIKLEFYVRSLKKMRCTCPAYCTNPQRDFIINFVHDMIEQLGIKT